MSRTLENLTRADVGTIIELGRKIWREHYVGIIGSAQVEYMIAQRFNPQYLGNYLNASDRWWRVLRVENEAVGYCSYALTSVPRELKLEQLYLRRSLHGQGLGRFMIEKVEEHAHSIRRDVITLQVNKNNEGAIAMYKKTGFVVREEIVLPIGGGFVMDDYIMAKQLSGAD